jgi:hypothetical protein
MLVLDWINPKMSIADIDAWLRNYLGSNYDGLVADAEKLWINTIDILTLDQETAIKSWYYTINNLPQKVAVEALPTYVAKTLSTASATKKLYKRLTGVQYDVVEGDNIFYFVIGYNWCKITGLEMVNSDMLEFCNFSITDSTTGAYSGVPNKVLSQFAYNVNLTDGSYKYLSEYDSDIYLGMQLKLEIHASRAKKIGINVFLDEVL